MSKKNNLNPDYYKTAGRGRQGDGIEQAVQRQQFNEEEARLAREEDPKRRAEGPAAREGQEEKRSNAVRGQAKRPPQREKKARNAKQTRPAK